MDSEVKVRPTIKLEGILPNTVSWIRILSSVAEFSFCTPSAPPPTLLIV